MKQQHKENVNSHSKKSEYYVYQFIREHGGWENWDMIEICKVSCADTNEARKFERQYMEELGATLNKRVPTRTKQEYYEDNIEHILKSKRQYRLDHAEEIAEKMHQYRIDHKEELAIKKHQRYLLTKDHHNKKSKQYHLEHRDELIEYARQYYIDHAEELREKQILKRQLKKSLPSI
jgi:hypothetical protein